MPFRFAAKHAVLTYAQANGIESKEALLEFLLSLGDACKVLVAKELHEDGGTHYHACVEFGTKFQSRDVACFDFMGCHPNISSPRSLKAWLLYCVKDGDYVNQGFVIGGIVSLVGACVEEAQKHSSVEDAVVATVVRMGDAALKQFAQIQGFIGLLMRDQVAYAPLKVWPGDFCLVKDSGHRVRWADRVEQFYTNTTLPAPRGVRDEFCKSLWIYGPSRMGKTHLARSLGRHWYMQNQWNAERLDSTAAYGVMDDIPWEVMRFNYKGMLGFQIDVTVTDKYRRKSVYGGGLGVVVVSNELPQFSDEEQAWLETNVDFIYINEPVWVSE